MEKKLNKIKVISTFYNAAPFIENACVSILTQDYDNFDLLTIDDSSTDGGMELIPSEIYKVGGDGVPVKDENGDLIVESSHPLLKKTKCKNILAWKSSERMTALRNIYNGIVNTCEPDDIVAIVDLDDMLIGKGALSYVNSLYNENPDLLCSWGSCLWSNGMKDFSSPYTEEEFKNLRKSQFKVSHLRTFKAKAFFEIIKQDPELKCFKDKNEEWYRSAYDCCIFYPLLEICGYDRSMHSSKKVYLYNLHKNNDHNISQSTQTNIHLEVLGKPSFKRME